MKRISFILLLIVFGLMTSTVVSARVKKHNQQKTSRIVKGSEWSEIGQSDLETWYLNTVIINFDVDGYPMVLVKKVPTKKYLVTKRKEMVNIFQDIKYKNFTHSIVQWKVDIDQSRMKIMTITHYAGNNMLNMDNVATHPDADWQHPPNNSLGEQVIKVVRAAFIKAFGR